MGRGTAKGHSGLSGAVRVGAYDYLFKARSRPRGISEPGRFSRAEGPRFCLPEGRCGVERIPSTRAHYSNRRVHDLGNQLKMGQATGSCGEVLHRYDTMMVAVCFGGILMMFLLVAALTLKRVLVYGPPSLLERISASLIPGLVGAVFGLVLGLLVGLGSRLFSGSHPRAVWE